jgi:gamma-glutamyl:cysteine ligase YbdK (ATP-grasp superfamily)
MTFGIEEEMFLVDAETLNCVCAMPETFERDCGR